MRASLRLGVTALLACASIGCQVREWQACGGVGCGPRSGPAASVLFGVAGLCVAFSLVGTVAVGWIGVQSARGAYHPARPSPLAGWSLYFQTLAVLSAVGVVLAFVRT
jgi:heme/copper-type cytochrome/quinol oxidase subunit 3